MRIRNRRIRLFMAGSLTAALGVLATVPFNMGGCSASNLNVAGLVNAGGKAIKAGSLDQRHERAIGESVSLALTNEYGVTTNQELARYVVMVGQTVASRTPRADKQWVFGVLETQEVNAFSGPGGYVWITRGAVEHMQNEAELAGVLGHEIGHVVKQHGLQAAKQAGLADAAVTAVQSSNDMTEFNGLSDKVADIIIKRGFSQPQEFEADAMSVKFVAAAGYDPNGFLHFLERIRQQQKSGGPTLFSTHPGMDERIKRVTAEISSAGTAGHGVTLQERFDQYTGQKPPVTMVTSE